MNTAVGPITAALTMSSREIAALTRKQHQHVRRDIEKMLSELAEDPSKFGRIYVDSRNRQQEEYHLDRELTDTLLTGYSARLRRKVIARWHQLEAQQASQAMHQHLGLMTRRLALESRDLHSKDRATLGSRLMLARRRELPEIRTERMKLDGEMQPGLFTN